MKKDRLKSRKFYYDCGICDHPEIKHLMKFGWNAAVVGDKFPKQLFERSGIPFLKRSVAKKHKGKIEFDIKKIRRVK